MDIFKRLNQAGKTIIMVTHEPDIAAHAGRQVTFRDGLIVGDTAGTTLQPTGQSAGQPTDQTAGQGA
jgi:putative ABC transport system ATP-binding protein